MSKKVAKRFDRVYLPSIGVYGDIVHLQNDIHEVDNKSIVVDGDIAEYDCPIRGHGREQAVIVSNSIHKCNGKSITIEGDMVRYCQGDDGVVVVDGGTADVK